MGGNYRSDDCNTFGSRKFPCFSAHKGEEDKNNVCEHFAMFFFLKFCFFGHNCLEFLLEVFDFF